MNFIKPLKGYLSKSSYSKAIKYNDRIAEILSDPINLIIKNSIEQGEFCFKEDIVEKPIATTCESLLKLWRKKNKLVQDIEKEFDEDNAYIINSLFNSINICKRQCDNVLE